MRPLNIYIRAKCRSVLLQIFPNEIYMRYYKFGFIFEFYVICHLFSRGWVDDDDDPIAYKISRRVELITGLATTHREVLSSAEAFQVHILIKD